MIGRLQGILIEKHPPELLIEINDVGYAVFAPMSTFYQLPKINEKVTLHTHLIVREDSHTLYGFFTKQERALFRALIKVNGVGPKLALTILSSIEPSTFVQCIKNNDTSTLVSIPGIGKKTAERLMIEMRDALSEWNLKQEIKFGKSYPGIIALPNEPAVQDALNALNTLGYKPQEARQAIQKIHEANISSEELIRLALKQMMK